MMKNPYQRAYLIIILAVLTQALAFILRVGSGLQIETLFFREHFFAQAAEMTTIVLAAPFLGFSLSLLCISPFLDWLGMRNAVFLAAVAFASGTLLTILAPENNVQAFHYLRIGAFLTGLGWGAVESVINPLVLAIYPQDKVRRLNGAHAWWGIGLILGGVLCLIMDYGHFSFQIKTSLVLIPAILLGILTLSTEFPVTERVQSGVSHKDMFLEICRRPTFIGWLVLMFLGSLTELGASQFVDIALSQLVGLKGVIILLYVAFIMVLMRRNAGMISSRVSSIGVLCIAMILATIGLYGLSFSQTPAITLVFATFWGMGAALIWPTMMANVSERYPKGGTFFLGLTALMGCLGVWLLTPQLGALYDAAKISTAGSVAILQQLASDSPEMRQVLIKSAAVVFQSLAMITGSLVIIYAIMWAVENWRKERGVTGRVKASL